MADGDAGRTAREVIWAIVTTGVLVVRLLATIGCVLFALLWVIAGVRYSLLNGWLWWVLGSGAILLVTTYAYSVLRVRYPSHSERWEP